MPAPRRQRTTAGALSTLHYRSASPRIVWWSEYSPRCDTNPVLEAAPRIVEREGVTLYAVGAEAGLPKGGLLYHFASREDLVQAIHQHLTDQYVLMPQSFGAWHPLLGFVRARRGTDEP